MKDAAGDGGASPLPGGSPLIGIFVGGESRRMGSPKGLLLEPEGSRTLLERLIDEVREAFPRAPLVLVGQRPEYTGYALQVIADARPHSGPLGGLVALLDVAARQGFQQVLALGCDFPRLTSSLLYRLMETEPQAAIVAPWLDQRWQPLVARYGVEVMRPLEQALREGRWALQPLLSALDGVRLELNEAERRQLVDWDRPRDIDRAL